MNFGRFQTFLEVLFPLLRRDGAARGLEVWRFGDLWAWGFGNWGVGGLGVWGFGGLGFGSLGFGVYGNRHMLPTKGCLVSVNIRLFARKM